MDVKKAMDVAVGETVMCRVGVLDVAGSERYGSLRGSTWKLSGALAHEPKLPVTLYLDMYEDVEVVVTLPKV